MTPFRRSLVAVSICTWLFGSQAATAETLRQMYDLAAGNDPQLKIAESTYEIGKQSLVQGRADLLPQINASAGYRTSVTSEPDVTERSGGDGNSWSITASQTLFDLTAWYNYKSSSLSTRSAESSYRQAQQDFILRVSNAYFDILRAVDTLETTLAEEAAVGTQLDRVKQQFDVGLIAITDVHEAQAAYDDILASKLSAQGNLGVAFENMTVLTGETHLSIAPLIEDFPIENPTPIAVADWEELSLENNPELESAEYAVGTAEYSAKTALVNNHLPIPRVQLNYGFTETNQLGGTPLTKTVAQTEGSSINVTATMPLFTGGSSVSSTKVAQQRVIQAEHSYDLTSRQLIQEVRSSHLLVRTNVAQVAASKQSLISSQTALDATRAGYDVGTRDLVDVLNAERNLRSAERAYLNARYDYIINLLRLKQTAGILNPLDIETLEQWLDGASEITRSQYQIQI